MSILTKLKTHSVLLLQPSQSQTSKSKSHIDEFEELHRNGLSDEEWEAKKRGHPGLFSESTFKQVHRTHNKSKSLPYNDE
nr:hypothetical protein [uncultured Methanobrevibacter sp.]